MSVALDAAAVTDLAGRVSGPVLTPEDPGYDVARACLLYTSDAADEL